MGHQIAAYILLQIIGRALRTDYAGKEGWCCIIRPKFDGETADDVLLHVLLDLEAMISLNPAGTTTTRAIVEKFVRTYFGTITLEGKAMDVAETVERTQNLYLRRLQNHRELSIANAHKICKERQISDSAHYAVLQSTVLTGLPTDPPSYWQGHGWKSWHHYLHGSDHAMEMEAFLEQIVRQKGLRNATQWTQIQHETPEFPTLQQISDGWYGDVSDIATLVARAGVRSGRR
jgi:hypothetical protein